MRLTIASLAAAILIVQAGPTLSQDRKVCADARDNAQAIRVCSEIIRAKPNDAVGYHLRGNALARNGDLGQAITDYNKAIHLNPKYAPAYDSRAVVYTTKGDFTRALADATKAAELSKATEPKGMGQETHGMATAKPKPKTSAWASKKQAETKQEPPAFNPFQDRSTY
jgi:Flp pilus assembly protein TadD